MNNSFVHTPEVHKVKNQQVRIKLYVFTATVVINKFVPNARFILMFILSLFEIHLALPKGIFCLNFQVKLLCAFPISSTCTSCPSYILINFITVNIQFLSP